jgi:hypothetical protein
VFQVELEYIPIPNLILGIEDGYTWTPFDPTIDLRSPLLPGCSAPYRAATNSARFVSRRRIRDQVESLLISAEPPERAPDDTIPSKSGRTRQLCWPIGG